ncbi:2-oxoadipate dioxygenase/decarboxylase HglS [Bradyrhizobium cenepequi]|uniref:2-oxoadipate dioxygenase/decarboxylase HglS n=1 Tax=Bradyrhizobium cenepequi TaxID=2821403 RepID=UPI001CE3B0EF|nr:VOC family protein [Bradyrhizobium cenepequi]MCA6111536.1 VOC family protein [Bradyrhizobium cenepequi]
MAARHAHSDDIRDRLLRAMSDMYRAEVPQYGTLLQLVADVNADAVRADPEMRASLEQSGEIERLGLERQGAIRIGTAQELFDIRRVFAVMGMHPVGYYDLSIAGVPVHSTAFRPTAQEALHRNPFRVFTSLLRLDLIEDPALRIEAERILSARRIFKPRTLELVDVFEAEGRLTQPEAEEFVREALQTFRWHSDATVDLVTYRKLHNALRLIADIVSFKGPHINHLTPRTLDIDAARVGMRGRRIAPKAVIEGLARRRCPILLRQTSFKALEEPIIFRHSAGEDIAGTHTARFGEIEQRGVALTADGRRLYDELLASVRRDVQIDAAGTDASTYDVELSERFKLFPDDWAELRSRGLAFFRYSATAAGLASNHLGRQPATVDELISNGFLQFDPIVYEDFLPVSAAGIFQSNIGTDEQKNYAAQSNRPQFEAELGAVVRDELELYAQVEKASLERALKPIGSPQIAFANAIDARSDSGGTSPHM